MAPLALYIHWPFCLKKCPYCDFNSHVRDRIDQARFARALRTELAWEAARLGRRPLASIFFGGGTPSLMDPETVARLIDDATTLFDPAPALEITLEANPTSVERQKLEAFRAAGVNRVSLGVQSLDPAALAFLGREHSAGQAIDALSHARATFPRTSFDLIYARPGQDRAAWRAELDRALTLCADHLSLYQLTIEPGTGFEGLHRQGRITLPDDDTAADLYRDTVEASATHGLLAYEVSNLARPGGESRHNLAYWRYADYAGIGPGAHGRLTQGRDKLATATERKPESWLEMVERDGHGILDQEMLGYDEQADELLLMGLRLKEGIDLVRWQQLSGRSPDPKREEFLLEHGFIERMGNSRLRCTPAGMLILDSVVADLAC
jgi:putative oxygen-independent coproporphyrinogen III oxidase